MREMHGVTIGKRGANNLVNLHKDVAEINQMRKHLNMKLLKVVERKCDRCDHVFLTVDGYNKEINCGCYGKTSMSKGGLL